MQFHSENAVIDESAQICKRRPIFVLSKCGNGTAITKKMLLIDAVSELEACRNAFAAGTPPRSPLGSLQLSIRVLAGYRGWGRAG